MYLSLCQLVCLVSEPLYEFKQISKSLLQLPLYSHSMCMRACVCVCVWGVVVVVVVRSGPKHEGERREMEEGEVKKGRRGGG